MHCTVHVYNIYRPTETNTRHAVYIVYILGTQVMLRQRNFRQNFMQNFPENFGNEGLNLFYESFA